LTSDSTPTEFAAVWRQFLIGRKNLLAQYDSARAHAQDQPVQTHHGVVGEAAVRDWLSTFLPKRFGVTPGYIRKQGFEDALVSSHFDVIIYDQLEAPTLWIESNPDKSPEGRSRIIPAEDVRAVIEVKATLDARSAQQAIDKLSHLAPLMADMDPPNEPYPRFLPASTLLASLFIELKQSSSQDRNILNIIRDATFARPFYGAVILRGEGKGDATGRIAQTISNDPKEASSSDKGLLGGFADSASVPQGSRHQGSMILWTALNFAMFAFDLLASVKGKYQPGRMSSLHGIDFSS
jgi:hypothetical protein